MKTTTPLLFFLLIAIAVSSWCLALRYRGASDFTDTVNYMAQAGALGDGRQFNHARIAWEDYVSGQGNLNATMSYPGQIFSLGLGGLSKAFNRPLELWMILAFNFFVYVLCCVFCLLFLARHLQGWEFFLVGFFSLTNFFVITACVSTGTDGLGFAFLLLTLWLCSLKKPRAFAIGVVFGVSFFVRAHLAIFALFAPILFCEKFNRSAIRCAFPYVLGILCAYGGVFGVLKLYVAPPLPPMTVAQYAQTHGLPFTMPDENQEMREQEKVSDNKSLSTFGWYYRQIAASFPTLKNYGVGWMTLGAYQTMGPTSWCFGPLFVAVFFSLFFRWSNTLIARYSLYVVCTFVTFFCAAYMLLVPAPAETMVHELKTLGRYFCYFFPLLPLSFWLIVRELLSPDMALIQPLEKMKQKIFGQFPDSRLILAGILLCLVFPGCFAYWGYGAALLARIPVRQGPIVFHGDDLLRKELRDLPPDCLVMSNNFTAVQSFSSVKHVVQNPASPEDFRRNKNNHLLEALVMFARSAKVKMTENEKEMWIAELNKDAIIDEQGNRFVKVCSHQGEGATEVLVERRTFVVYRREADRR